MATAFTRSACYGQCFIIDTINSSTRSPTIGSLTSQKTSAFARVMPRRKTWYEWLTKPTTALRRDWHKQSIAKIERTARKVDGIFAVRISLTS